jgi:hypothetical protein
MKIKTLVAILATTVGLWGSGQAVAAIAHFQVALTGFQEVSAPNQFNNGDPDAFGVADLLIDSSTNTIDWHFCVADLTLPLTGAHIHQGAAGTNGPIVVDFGAQLSGTGLVDPDLASVIANPKGFYVNLHNADFPGGAIRGQLGDALPNQVPLPPAVWLFGSGLLGLIGVARRKTAS